MNGFMEGLSAILQITFIDLIMSGDNVGVIALAIRNLSPADAKKASAVGIGAALFLNVLFASIVTVIISVSWLPLRLVGGLLLLKITWDLINADGAEEEHGVKDSSSNFWKAVSSIVIADVSMRLDNALAIGATAEGSIGLIAFGVALNFPILLYGTKYVANLMQKHKIVIYVGGAILMHTAWKMIFEDTYIAPHVPHLLGTILAWGAALAVVVYGYIKLEKEKKADMQGRFGA